MPNALADLIRDEMDRGTSLRQIAVRAGDAGLRTRFSYLLNADEGLTEMPKPGTLAGLALALRVPVKVVVLAAAQACGLDVEGAEGSALLTLLPAEAQWLDDSDVDLVRALVRTLGDARRRLASPEKPQ